MISYLTSLIKLTIIYHTFSWVMDKHKWLVGLFHDNFEILQILEGHWTSRMRQVW